MSIDNLAQLRSGEFDVSVVIVSYNTAHLVTPCLDALKVASEGLRVEVIVVDNASSDVTPSLVRQHAADVLLIANQVNVGFGRANNQALPSCRGRLVLLLNMDAIVDADALRTAVAALDSDPAIGIVGARLRGLDGELQPSWRFFPTLLGSFASKAGVTSWMPSVAIVDPPCWNPDRSADCDWVPGCFLLTRKSIADSIGLFDPRYFMYCEEVDFCMRVKRAGWRVRYLGNVGVVHIGGESAKSLGDINEHARQLPALQIESQLLYWRKHAYLPGAIAHVALEAVAVVVLGLKSLLRRNRSWLLAWREFTMLLGLFVRTRAGAVPTR